jgi:hypothetical protein
MDDVPDEDLVVPRGRSRTIAFARDASGARPAKQFLEQDVPVSLRMRLRATFRFLAEEGRIDSTKWFKKERGDIWAFKTGNIRVACFSKGRVWYLTHGFVKRRDRWPAEELSRAERIRWEHLMWMNRERRMD